MTLVSGLLRCGYADREAKCLGVKPVGSAIAVPVLHKHLPAVRELVARGAGPCAVARELKLPLSSAHKLVKIVRAETTATLEKMV